MIDGREFSFWEEQVLRTPLYSVDERMAPLPPLMMADRCFVYLDWVALTLEADSEIPFFAQKELCPRGRSLARFPLSTVDGREKLIRWRRAARNNER